MTDPFDFDHPREHGALSRGDAASRVSLAYAPETDLGNLPGAPVWALVDVPQAPPVCADIAIICERCGAAVAARLPLVPYGQHIMCGACGQGYSVELRMPERPS